MGQGERTREHPLIKRDLRNINQWQCMDLISIPIQINCEGKKIKLKDHQENLKNEHLML